MGTTSRGIVYPDQSGIPSRAALQELAESVNGALDAIMSALGLDGQRILRGDFLLGVGTTAVGQNVTFDIPFSAAPWVGCDVIDTGAPGNNIVARWGSASTNSTTNSSGAGTPTGFYFQAQRPSGSNPIRVKWTAIGPA